MPKSKDDELTRTVISAPISISSPHPDEPKENTSNIFIYIKKRLSISQPFFTLLISKLRC